MHSNLQQRLENVLPFPEHDVGGVPWESFLSSQIASDWRTSEWDPVLNLFVGDATNPATGVYYCAAAGCEAFTATQGSFCEACRASMKMQGISNPADYINTAPRRPLKQLYLTSQPRPRCEVERDGIRCARQVFSLEHGEYCQHHHQLVHENLRRGNVADRVKARLVPMDAIDECRFPLCQADQGTSGPVCAEHERTRLSKYSHAPVEEFLQSLVVRLPHNVIDFSIVSPTARLEILYALQSRDRDGLTLTPRYARKILTLIGPHKTLLTVEDPGANLHANSLGHLRDMKLRLMQLRLHWSSEDPWASDVWDGGLLRLRSSKKGQIAKRVVLDFSRIRVDWLRQMVKDWALAYDKDATSIRGAIQAFEVASEVLLLHHAHPLPPRVTSKDAGETLRRFTQDRKPDGSAYSAERHKYLVNLFREVILHAREVGVPRKLASGYAVTRLNRPKAVSTDPEDRAGRALPDSVIKTLDKHLHLLQPKGKVRNRLGWTTDDQAFMLRTMYQVHRDTGRRPSETLTLRVNCLVHQEDGTYSLTYDNMKAGRYNRSLPIDSTTAGTIRSWQDRLRVLSPDAPPEAYLFPSPGLGNNHRNKPYNTSSFGYVLGNWVNSIPSILTSEMGPDGLPLPFDRTSFTLYSFRHSFAQRHADAGTPIDVLRALMDHKNIDQTMGYYRVGMERKSKAVQLVSKYMTQVSGSSPGPVDTAAYERQTVAVPFGTCGEPSNVKAGGQACQLAFKCSGCSFFKSDPSYLPELNAHIQILRKQVESALLFATSTAIIEGMKAELDLFIQIRDSIQEQLTTLAPEARTELNEAVATLRKVRSSKTFLPTPTIRRKSDAVQESRLS